MVQLAKMGELADPARLESGCVYSCVGSIPTFAVNW